MDEQPKFHADDPEEQVNVGRYLRFVIVFLMIMFGALGAYEYYYGAQAMKVQELHQVSVPAAATSTAEQ